MRDESRHEFLKLLVPRLGGLAGLASWPGAAYVAKATIPPSKDPKSDPETLFNTTSKDYLLTTKLDRVVKAFHGAPTGTLMFHYHAFWPLFLRDNPSPVQVVEELRDLCGREREEDYERWHLVRVLPPAAASHALSMTSGEDTRKLQALIFETHKAALNEQPHRNVLEIIWQNLIAALIGNPFNWHRLSVGHDVLSQAADVCSRFLTGEHSDLLFAAGAAWQFLLTYERSLLDRADPASQNELYGCRAALNRVGPKDVPEFAWLSELQRLYRGRNSYSDMLPQISETMMARGQPVLLPRVFFIRNQEAVDLFTLIRLQVTYLMWDAAANNRPFRYTPPERVRQVVPESVAFLAGTGLLPTDWPHLKRIADQTRIPFSRPALTYIDDLFNKYEREVGRLGGPSPDAEWFARWVPFRDPDGKRLFCVMHPDLLDPSIPDPDVTAERVDQLLSAAPSDAAEGLAFLWAPIASAAELEMRRGNPEARDEVVQVALLEHLSELAHHSEARPHRETLEVLRRISRDLRRTVFTWVAQPPLEAAVAGSVPSTEGEKMDPSPPTSPEAKRRLRAAEIEEEFKRRGIDIWDFLSDDLLAKLSQTDLRLIDEWRRCVKGDPEQACWYPVSRDDKLAELARQVNESSRSNKQWRESQRQEGRRSAETP